jgi:deazaflavin-dependent oxidoreductase (nitroreductase family)
VAREFRANEGKVGGNFEGAPVLLRTTTGRKSGRSHTNPMMFLPAGDDVVVFASKGGSDTDPDWYLNLVNEPTVTVEIGTQKYQAMASTIDRAEQDELYAEQAALYPGFAEYEAKTTRLIPVVRLVRAA